ncbi:MAG: hypothetical protein MI976_04365 [Pseudomonadales bacterium]|nr:hypothetical protein [Pseudomonadales bacterium]
MQPLVFQQSAAQLANGKFGEILHVQGGPVVVLSETAIASYKSFEAVADPLGNGRLGYAELPQGVSLQAVGDSYVAGLQAGVARLHNGMCLLITPFHASLFYNNEDALTGNAQLAQVPLNDIDLL